MQQSSLLPARTLSPAVKQALEDLLGRPLTEDESVSVRTYQTQEVPVEETRLAALRGLQHYFEGIDRQLGASPEEMDLALDEALSSVRPGYTPVR